MFFGRFRKYDNIGYEDLALCAYEVLSDYVHEPLEVRWNVGQTEGQSVKLVMPKRNRKAGSLSMFFLNTDLLESTVTVQDCKIFRTEKGKSGFFKHR